MENAYSVLIAVISTLGGASAFRYYEKRAAKKDEEERFVFNDCRSRISKLEGLLERAAQEKDELRGQIIKLVEEVSALRTEVKFLQEKNTHRNDS